MENQKQQQTGIIIAESLSPVKEASPLAGRRYSYETTTTTTTTTRSSSPSVSAETSEVEQDDDQDTSMEDVSGENTSAYDADNNDDDDTEEAEDEDENEDEDEDEDEVGEDESFTKDNRCLRCLKVCAQGSRADHRRVHCLEGAEGVAVPEANKCTCCVYLGTRCIVAREPRHKGLNTVRCLKCISKGRSCSFKKTYDHLRVSSLRFHPAKLAWS